MKHAHGTVMPEPGGQGGHWPPQYLADQLALFQPGRADYPHLSLLAPPMFFTFRHHWNVTTLLNESIKFVIYFTALLIKISYNFAE